MQIDYYHEMLSVVTALLLCPIIPLFHVILNRLTNSMLIVRHTLIATFIYIILWLVSIVYIKQIHLINNYELSRLIVGGVSTIGFIVFGYMELIGHPFRGYTLELLTNIYLQESTGDATIMRSFNDISKDLMEDRIRIMKRFKMVNYDGNEVSLTLLGKLIGKIGISFKNSLNMSK